MSDDQAREMRPETTSEHIARDMREGRFPEQSERQMVPVLASLPHEIQVWRSTDSLDHIGTWATTRFPPEAVTYVPKASASKLIRQHGEIARQNFLHLMEVEAERDRLRADAQAAVALIVEQAAEVCDDLAIGYAKHKGVPGALHDAARDIRALAPADGLAAENASLKAREKVDANLLLAAYKGLLVLHRMLSKSGLSVGAETATYITDQIAAAHPEMPGLASLRAAPTDPGDGWTWNERLGWIGPDGKPADPRRRW